MDYLWIAVLMALGLAMAFKPEFLWKLEHMFTTEGGRPTELYLTLMRVGGAFFIVSSVVAAVAAAT